MKWIFLLLLAANTAILLWGWRQEATPDTRRPSIAAGMGNLHLYSRPGEAMPKMIPPPFSDEAGLADASGQAAVPDESLVADVAAVESTPAEATMTGEPAGKSEVKAAAVENIDAERPQTPEPLKRAETAEITPARPVATAPEGVAEMPAPPESCGLIGPMDDNEVAATIVDELKKLGIEASLQQESQQKPNGFWVIIPPLPTRQQAIDTVKRLNQLGVKDNRRFYKGEFRDGVSLGIYSRRKNAEKRRDFIAAMGFEPSVVPRIQDFTLYRVDYRASGSETGQALQALISRHPELEHQEQSCPADGSAVDLEAAPDQP